jgi:hypothetical protein
MKTKYKLAKALISEADKKENRRNGINMTHNFLIILMFFLYKILYHWNCFY